MWYYFGMKFLAVRAHKKLLTAIIVIGIIITALLATLAINQYLSTKAKETYEAHPLGDPSKLEYVGEVSYGCWLLCDANPASTYYYVTSLKPPDIANIFTKAQLYRPIQQDIESTRIWLINSNVDFILSYYPNPSVAGIKNVTQSKKHVVSIPSLNYQKAVNAL